MSINKRRGPWKHGGKAVGRTTPEYQAWQDMIKRCENANTRGFKYWGGRGIKVCRRWRKSFQTFLGDVGRRPTGKHMLDRKNVNGHYTPSNVRWATRLEQNRNRRDNLYVTVRGQRQLLRVAAERLGINHSTLRGRLKYRRFKNLAIDRPVEGGWKLLTFSGETHTQAVWAKRVGISQASLCWRLKRGWPIRRALTEKSR